MDPALPTLHARRCRLRALDDGDLPALRVLFGDPEVVRFMDIPLLRSQADGRAFLAEVRAGLESRTLFEWGIVAGPGRSGEEVPGEVPGDVPGELIGTCTLSALDWKNRRAEVGFALRASHRGQGFMAEALSAVIDHGFGALGLHRVEADIDPRNAASIRLVERLGFIREGAMKERHLVAGEWQDTVFFGLLARDWQARE